MAMFSSPAPRSDVLGWLKLEVTAPTSSGLPWLAGISMIGGTWNEQLRNLGDRKFRNWSDQVVPTTTVAELRLKLYSMTGCEPACQWLRIPLAQDQIQPAGSSLASAIQQPAGSEDWLWLQSEGQTVALVLAQKRLALAKFHSTRLSSGGSAPLLLFLLS